MNRRKLPRLQRKIQEEIAKADKKHPKKKANGAMQVGEYPAPPFPKQHQPKPGLQEARQIKSR
jgi:hypothetical protein